MRIAWRVAGATVAVSTCRHGRRAVRDLRSGLPEEIPCPCSTSPVRKGEIRTRLIGRPLTDYSPCRSSNRRCWEDNVSSHFWSLPCSIATDSPSMLRYGLCALVCLPVLAFGGSPASAQADPMPRLLIQAGPPGAEQQAHDDQSSAIGRPGRGSARHPAQARRADRGDGARRGGHQTAQGDADAREGQRASGRRTGGGQGPPDRSGRIP